MGKLEDPIHRSIVGYLKSVLPRECIVHHSPNEGNRGGVRGARDGDHRKAMGVRAGFPDIIVIPFVPLQPVFLEVKAPTGKVEDSQKEFAEDMQKLGRDVYIVRSIDDARDALRAAGVGTTEVDK